jgi:hypothetical protein
MDVFVLMGNSDRMFPGNVGSGKYLVRPKTYVLADPITWEVMSGEIGDEIKEIDSRHQ